MSDDRRGIFERADEFATIFRRGAEFAKELVQENERLLHDIQQRWEVAQRQSAEAQRRMDQTQARIQHLDSATARTSERLRRLRAELAEVNAIWHKARTGEGQVLLISGEPKRMRFLQNSKASR